MLARVFLFVIACVQVLVGGNEVQAGEIGLNIVGRMAHRSFTVSRLWPRLNSTRSRHRPASPTGHRSLSVR